MEKSIIMEKYRKKNKRLGVHLTFKRSIFHSNNNYDNIKLQSYPTEMGNVIVALCLVAQTARPKSKQIQMKLLHLLRTYRDLSLTGTSPPKVSLSATNFWQIEYLFCLLLIKSQAYLDNPKSYVSSDSFTLCIIRLSVWIRKHSPTGWGGFLLHVCIAIANLRYR